MALTRMLHPARRMFFFNLNTLLKFQIKSNCFQKHWRVHCKAFQTSKISWKKSVSVRFGVLWVQKLRDLRRFLWALNCLKLLPAQVSALYTINCLRRLDLSWESRAIFCPLRMNFEVWGLDWAYRGCFGPLLSWFRDCWAWLGLLLSSRPFGTAWPGWVCYKGNLWKPKIVRLIVFVGRATNEILSPSDHKLGTSLAHWPPRSGWNGCDLHLLVLVARKCLLSEIGLDFRGNCWNQEKVKWGSCLELRMFAMDNSVVALEHTKGTIGRFFYVKSGMKFQC